MIHLHIYNDKKIKLFNNGKCKRDFTFIDDIIDGIIEIMNCENLGYDIINLGESFTIKTIDLVTKIEKLIGKISDKELLPPQAGDVEITYADISHAKKRYNYEPKYPIDDGLVKFVDWYRKRQ